MNTLPLSQFWFTRIFLLLAFTGAIFSAATQNISCPENLDFEKGNFTNWRCLHGRVEAEFGQNVLYLSDTVPTTNFHAIISAGRNEVDRYGEFPRSCPNGSGYSVMLGNDYGGHEAAGISYTFTIPDTATDFSITYHYAVVLENPPHAFYEQPRFRARIIDISDESELNCVSFDFVSSSDLPGFKVSPISPDVMYKDWTPITVSLLEYAGKTLRLEFITSDCTFNAHFGYAYVDVNSSCNNTLATASLCDGDKSLTLNAPYGFQLYQWYSNNDYSTMVGDSITYIINPVPPSANTYSVIVTPYPGYGCIDTFYAPVKWQPKPLLDAGPSRSIDCNTIVQLGSQGYPEYTYSWTPADKLSGVTLANPSVSKYIISPVNYVVKATDKITACVSIDSVLITPIKCFLAVPTGFTPNGDGLNDKLIPTLGSIKWLRRFSIFNRYGQIVFSTSREGEGWDGTYKGVKLDTGVFVWMLEYVSMDDRPGVEKGTITLIR